MLLQELESREAYLQDLKNSLFKRVEVAEYQMNKLISLRNEETEEAQKASKILRSSIAKLRERFIIDKKELENKVCYLVVPLRGIYNNIGLIHYSCVRRINR